MHDDERWRLGIRNDAAEQRLARAGLCVVRDLRMMPEHRHLHGAA
jgi:predicted CoA-binding protein